jgi:hypothetical protein
VTIDLSKYSINYWLGGAAPLDFEGERGPHEEYVMSISGAITYHPGKDEVPEDEEFPDHGLEVGTFSGAKVLANLIELDGHDLLYVMDRYSHELMEAWDIMDRSGLLDEFPESILVVESIDLEPAHDHLDVKLHVIGRVARMFWGPSDQTLVTPVPEELRDQLKWRYEPEGSRLAMTLWRVAKDWLKVV